MLYCRPVNLTYTHHSHTHLNSVQLSIVPAQFNSIEYNSIQFNPVQFSSNQFNLEANDLTYHVTLWTSESIEAVTHTIYTLGSIQAWSQASPHGGCIEHEGNILNIDSKI